MSERLFSTRRLLSDVSNTAILCQIDLLGASRMWSPLWKNESNECYSLWDLGGPSQSYHHGMDTIIFCSGGVGYEFTQYFVDVTSVLPVNVFVNEVIYPKHTWSYCPIISVNSFSSLRMSGNLQAFCVCVFRSRTSGYKVLAWHCREEHQQDSIQLRFKGGRFPSYRKDTEHLSFLSIFTPLKPQTGLIKHVVFTLLYPSGRLYDELVCLLPHSQLK